MMVPRDWRSEILALSEYDPRNKAERLSEAFLDLHRTLGPEERAELEATLTRMLADPDSHVAFRAILLAEDLKQYGHPTENFSRSMGDAIEQLLATDCVATNGALAYELISSLAVFPVRNAGQYLHHYLWTLKEQRSRGTATEDDFDRLLYASWLAIARLDPTGAGTHSGFVLRRDRESGQGEQLGSFGHTIYVLIRHGFPPDSLHQLLLQLANESLDLREMAMKKVRLALNELTRDRAYGISSSTERYEIGDLLQAAATALKGA